MNYQDIKFQAEDGIGFITLSRPEKRNALSIYMMAEMIDLLKSIKNNRKVKAVIIRAEGSSPECAVRCECLKRGKDE